MKPFSRADRVGSHIQRALSDLLAKEIKDPRLSLVVISGVKLTRDLRIARVYFTTTGGTIDPEAAIDGFNRALGFIKRELARSLGLRYMPDLAFFYDESYDYGTRIDTLLRSVQGEHVSDYKPVDDEQPDPGGDTRQS